MNTHETKLLEAVRLMQKSVNNLEAVIVEQIGHHAVVTAETKEPELTELPQLWYVENYDKSKEWYMALNHRTAKKHGNKQFISKFTNKKKPDCIDGIIVSLFDATQLTREEFERLVYTPWKESLKPKQFDPNTADKTRFYRGLHKLGYSGIVHYVPQENAWGFSSLFETEDISVCTHIDYNPIDYSDIPEYKHID